MDWDDRYGRGRRPGGPLDEDLRSYRGPDGGDERDASEWRERAFGERGRAREPRRSDAREAFGGGFHGGHPEHGYDRGWRPREVWQARDDWRNRDDWREREDWHGRPDPREFAPAQRHPGEADHPRYADREDELRHRREEERGWRSRPHDWHDPGRPGHDTRPWNESYRRQQHDAWRRRELGTGHWLREVVGGFGTGFEDLGDRFAHFGDRLRGGPSHDRFGHDRPAHERGHGPGWFDRMRDALHLGAAARSPKGYRRSDERIREDVCEMLAEDRYVDAREVEVTVKDGEVTLAGTVPDRSHKRLVEDIAHEARGVRDVHNRLRIDLGLGARDEARGDGRAPNGDRTSARS